MRLHDDAVAGYLKFQLLHLTERHHLRWLVDVAVNTTTFVPHERFSFVVPHYSSAERHLVVLTARQWIFQAKEHRAVSVHHVVTASVHVATQAGDLNFSSVFNDVTVVECKGRMFAQQVTSVTSLDDVTFIEPTIQYSGCAN
ncbi:hypothetical protein D3C80_1587950 [compost metagenome]